MENSKKLQKRNSGKKLASILLVLVMMMTVITVNAATVYEYTGIIEGADLDVHSAVLFNIQAQDEADAGSTYGVYCADWDLPIDTDGSLTFYPSDISGMRITNPLYASDRQAAYDKIRTILSDVDGNTDPVVITAAQMAIWNILTSVSEPMSVEIQAEFDRLMALPVVSYSPSLDITHGTEVQNYDGTANVPVTITYSGVNSISYAIPAGTSLVGTPVDDGSKITFTLKVAVDTSYSCSVEAISDEKVLKFFRAAGEGEIQPFIGLVPGFIATGCELYVDPPKTGRIILRKIVEGQDTDYSFTVKFTHRETGLVIEKQVTEQADVSFELPAGTYDVQEINIPSYYQFISISPNPVVVVDLYKDKYTSSSFDGSQEFPTEKVITVTVYNLYNPPSTPTPPPSTPTPPPSTPTPPPSTPTPTPPPEPTITPEPVPEGPVDETVIEIEVPQAAPELPKTAGIPVELFMFGGASLVALGMKVNKKK